MRRAGAQLGIKRNFEKTIEHYEIENPDSRYDPIKIPIKLIRDLNTTKFSCIDKARNIRVENASIDAVLQEVDQIIKGRAGIVWKPKLALTMESVLIPDPENGAFELKLDMKVKAIETGVDESGERWERNQGSLFIQSEIIRKGLRRWGLTQTDAWRDRDVSRVLIDDTPANRIAIENLADRFRQFIDQIYKIIEPDQIEQTIKVLSESSAFLLPAGKPEDK